jgi:hypothetical protein
VVSWARSLKEWHSELDLLLLTVLWVPLLGLCLEMTKGNISNKSSSSKPPLLNTQPKTR